MSTVRIQLDKTMQGRLMGYHIADPADVRRHALQLAMDIWGSAYVIKKLVVLATYRKARYPKDAATIKLDYQWVQSRRNAMPAQNREANRRKWAEHKTIKAGWVASRASSSANRKACAAGKVRNASTGRCRIIAPSTPRKLAAKRPVRKHA